MKLFGRNMKAKRSADASNIDQLPPSTSEIHGEPPQSLVPSYFDNGKLASSSIARQDGAQECPKKAATAPPTDDGIRKWAAADPASLTSRQRRLVKRYASRRANEDDDALSLPAATTGDATPSGPADADDPAFTPRKGPRLAVPTAGVTENCACVGVLSPGTGVADGTYAVEPNLEGLNAKQRRRAMRLRMYGKAPASPPSKVAVKKKGKKRGKVDPSALTPEEAGRREKQRRIQRETAEARARAAEEGLKEGKQYAHPLNSERRRANRRKRKMAEEKRVSNRSQQNKEGFMMRKKSRF